MARQSLTIPYSAIDDLEINLDIHFDPSTAQGAVPAVVFFHGGGLVCGSRDDFYVQSHKQALEEPLVAAGLIYISADYRLLHPSTGHDQIADVKALFTFLASPQISSHLPSGLSIDQTRIGVIGASAGAYIGRLAVLYATPRPKAFVSYYGMGGDFLADAMLVPMTSPPALSGKFVEKDEVAHLIGANVAVKPISSSPVIFRPTTGTANDDARRQPLYGWFIRNGILIDYLTGDHNLSAKLRALPSFDERQAAIPSSSRALFPQLHITESFPPTLQLHGAVDSLVLLAESVKTHEQLMSVGVKSELLVAERGEHGLVDVSKGPGQFVDEADEFNSKVVEFLLRELRR